MFHARTNQGHGDIPKINTQGSYHICTKRIISLKTVYITHKKIQTWHDVLSHLSCNSPGKHEHRTVMNVLNSRYPSGLKVYIFLGTGISHQLMSLNLHCWGHSIGNDSSYNLIYTFFRYNTFFPSFFHSFNYCNCLQLV